jgi:hypothetical protein
VNYCCACNKQHHEPVATDRCITACVEDFAIVVAVTGRHLVLGQRARLVAGDASGAAQRFNSFKVLHKNIHVLHLDSGEGQCDGELICFVRISDANMIK